MTGIGGFRYRAFMSYSHRDREVGDKLHRALESYRVPRTLIGKAAAFGAIPEKLRPIFRDRFDLEAGPSLRKQLVDALRASEALIVVCSPASAISPYVNEEIRLFKANDSNARIYPIIVAGEPGHSKDECFPAALRHRVDANGSITDTPEEEPIAADMRPHGDGEELARLKLIAGLLGIDLDELRRREDGERRRRQRQLIAVTGFMTLLAILAIGFAAFSFVLNSRLEVALANEAEARQEAQTRYQQAATSTLRWIVIAATFRSLYEGTAFQTSQIEEKGGSLAFQKLLDSAPDGNAVWLQLAQILAGFADSLPSELRRYQQPLDALQMQRQWLEHAAVILTNLVRGNPDEPQYRSELERVRAELERYNTEMDSPSRYLPRETN